MFDSAVKLVLCNGVHTARWVPQSIVPSNTSSAVGRVRYLEPIIPRVDEAIEDYRRTHPDGDAYTVAVLSALGVDGLDAIRGERTQDTVKQDVGRLVPIRMVERFGAHVVETLREDAGTKPSTRPPPLGTPGWIKSFTPHRVRHGSIRIVLDANVVRSALFAAGPMEFLDRLAAVRGDHPVSIADPAWAELVRSFHQHPQQLAAWRAVSSTLDGLLDPVLPICPSGREAAAMAKAAADLRGYDPRAAADFYRLTWKYTAAVRRVEDFQKRARLVRSSGDGIEIGPLDPSGLHAEFERRFTGFRTFVERTIVAQGMSPEQSVDFIRAGLRRELTDDAVESLDLYIRAVVLYAEDLRRDRNPRTAKDNDAIDLDILFCAVLPAWICSGDRRLCALAERTKSGDAGRVMSPEDLLRRLEAERA
jgi:hypothetical protein